MKSKKNKPRPFDFRIKYVHEDAIEPNYHYYNCFSAEEALSFQREIIEHRGWNIKLLSVERKNPYSEKWEDESEVLDGETDLAK